MHAERNCLILYINNNMATIKTFYIVRKKPFHDFSNTLFILIFLELYLKIFVLFTCNNNGFAMKGCFVCNQLE